MEDDGKIKAGLIARFLLKMNPLQRMLMSLVLAAAVWVFIYRLKEDNLFLIICTWCAFAVSYLATSWVVLVARGVPQTKLLANREEGSRAFVLGFSILCALAAMVSVLILVVSSGRHSKQEYITIPVSFLSVLLSWALVHTILTFHYAFVFYSGVDEISGGIDFAGTAEPNYLDFAYFSFTIGMTFQVSDSTVNSSKMRRLVLAHGLLSFVLNTFVVALTVNFIAGLKG